MSEDAVEQALDRLVPREWSDEDLLVLLGHTAFKRDLEAITQTLNKPIRELVFRGGKRLRPKLFLTILEGFEVDAAKYVDIAALIELVHCGTLAVDDVEDNSDIRRGKSSLHKMYGVDIAVNAGNAMYFLPIKAMLMHKHLSDAQRLQLLEVYIEEMINVHVGQATDISWHNGTPKKISEDMYMEMCRLKTGCLMRMSVRFACAIAEQGEGTEQSLKHFAELAGVAFQIQDDVLDLTADTREFGKLRGHDITEGKISLPVIFALEELAENDKQRLIDILKMHTDDQGIINEGRQLILQTDALDEAKRKAHKLLNQAWLYVSPVEMSSVVKRQLKVLTGSFVKRSL